MVVIVLLVSVSVWAGDAGVESPFTVGVGARALGLGGGFTSVANDASAIYWNPAGLSRLNYQEVTAMHMSLFEGTIYNYVSWVYPTVSLGGFGLGVMRLGTNDIVRREGFVETGQFDYSHSQVMLSYGREFHPDFAAGVSLKLVYQTLDVYSDWGVGFDLGLIARPHDQVSLGMVLRDVVPAGLTLDETEETFPLSVAGGISIREVRLAESIEALLSFELEKIEDRSVRVHSGAEVVFDEAYALRVGYDRENLALGAGVRQGRFQFDYAYKIMDYIDDSHRFSLSYDIGPSIADQAEEQRLAELRRGSDLLEEERRRQFALYKERADRFYHQYRLDSALTYYQRALAFDEDNQEIVGTIAAIESSRRVQRDQEADLRERQHELSRMMETYLDQARSFAGKEYYPAALDMIQLIFEIDPNYAPARSLKNAIEAAMASAVSEALEAARLARREGNTVAAIGAYERVLYLDPNNLTAQRGKEALARSLDVARHLNTGIDLFKSGRYEDARRQFELVLSVSPNEPVAEDYLRRIESALAQPPTLEEIQEDPVVWQWYLEGLRFMRNQEYRKAIDAWEQVLQKYPGNEATLDNIEQARLRLQPNGQE